MSTPHEPGDPAPDPARGSAGGATPQDPADPQNPYAAPPSDQPTTAIPPTAPVYGTDPSTPAAPTYGQPTSGPPTSEPPAYGQPGQPTYGQPAYGQPAYGQPTGQPQPGPPVSPPPDQPAGQPYGQPGYPQHAAPAEQEPGKGMAITALVLSFLCCLAIPGIILAIVVLVRSRDGRNRGKGLAIAAIVVGTLSLAATAAVTYVAVDYVQSLVDVNDLEEGDCVTAEGLTDAESESVTDIAKVSCSQEHDGEVLATAEVAADQAGDAGAIDTATVCSPAIEAAGKSALITEEITVTALTDAEPATGDTIACIAYRVDGEPLTARLGS